MYIFRQVQYCTVKIFGINLQVKIVALKTINTSMSFSLISLLTHVIIFLLFFTKSFEVKVKAWFFESFFDLIPPPGG